MKKKLTTIVLLLALFVSTSFAQRTFSLVCAVSNYDDPHGFCCDLGFPAKGAKSMKKVYKQMGAIPVVLTSKYVTEESVQDKLKSILKIAKPEDIIIFHFIGHGSAGNIYFYQGRPYSYSKLIALLSKAQTENIFCIIDACESGSAIRTATDEYENMSGVKPAFMMACRANENTGELGALASPVFTLAVAKGLRGRADANSDHKVTFMELFRYAHSDMVSRGESLGWSLHPQLLGNSKLFETVISEIQ